MDPFLEATDLSNPMMRGAREAALQILKPSSAELEHGLAVHRDSIVFDTYGFSPRLAPDVESRKRLVEEGASDLELEDLGEEMSMTRCVTDEAEREQFIEGYETSGVTCVFQNAGQEGQDPLRLIKRLARYTYVTDFLRDFIFKAVTPADIVRAKKEGRRCLYLTGNGVPLTQQWVSVSDELRYVRIFYQLGIRMMHLTYQRRNMIGDGCAEKANAGLSDFGYAVIEEMNRIGIIVDVAHCGWQTSLEAAKASRVPMVASHTTCGSLNPHIRSKPDEVIRAIVETGGLVGICCISEFLGEKGDINSLLNHIDYMVEKFGIDHVGIGSDKAYVSANYPRSNPSPSRRPNSHNWSALWPPKTFKTTPEAELSLAWTNWPLFTVGLVQRGYSDADIRKILGGNMLRVAQAVMEARAYPEIKSASKL